MKHFRMCLLILLIMCQLSNGQSSDQLNNKCIASTGSDSKYLKDFRVQLGQSNNKGDFRYKANISLWKDMRYRFTMCDADESKGQLILNVKDGSNKIILSSFDPKTGKAYTSVDFVCSQSGIYQLGYDFTNDQQGSGVGIVSLIK